MYITSIALLGLPIASAQLNELAQKAGKLYFGTATDNGELNNTEYVSILTNKTEFGQLTPSNGQKWVFVEPEQGVFNFTDGHVVTDLAKKDSQLLRCHNLVWYSQLADWVTATNWTKDAMRSMIRDHVTQEVTEWKGQCYAWDVVNEGLNDDGTYRESIFYTVLGPEYIKIAYEAASLADPHAKLYYNDYNIESQGNKSEGVIQNIIEPLQKAGIRIDGIGLQGHFIAGQTPSIDDQISTLKSYVELGLETAYTEVDIRIVLPLNESNLAQQKADYTTTVGACMQVEKCVGITVWDFYDPFSWVPSTFPGQGAADLYFKNFTQHPAYQGVVDALTNGTHESYSSSSKKRSWKLF